MPYSGLFYQDGNLTGQRAGPTVLTVNYTCTDASNGFTANAQYILTVHDQWENIQLESSEPMSSLEQGALGAIGPLASANWNETVSGSASLSANFTGGFSAAQLATFGISVGTSSTYTVGASQGVTSEPIPAGYISYPYLEAFWTRNYYLVENYVPAGPNGTFTQAIDVGPTTWGMGWTTPVKMN
jgi:hypothetical protein